MAPWAGSDRGVNIRPAAKALIVREGRLLNEVAPVYVGDVT